MSTTMKGPQRSIKLGSSIVGVGHFPANQLMKKLRKTNIQVKVALIGAVSVVVAAIITAILGPALINRIATPTPTPVYVAGQYNGTINSTALNTGTFMSLLMSQTQKAGETLMVSSPRAQSFQVDILQEPLTLLEISSSRPKVTRRISLSYSSRGKCNQAGPYLESIVAQINRINAT